MKTSWVTTIWGSLLVIGLRSMIAPEPSQAADLQTIRDRGYIIVGIKPNLAPISFQTISGEPDGFEVAIAQHLALDIFGKSDAVQWKRLSNADRLTAVISDRVDLTIAQVTATESRRRWVAFSAPYYFEVGAVAVHSPALRTLSALRGQSVAVLNQSSTAIAFTEQFPEVRLRPVTSYQEAFDRLQRGEVQAVAGDRLALSQYLTPLNGFRFLNTEIGLYPFAIALPKGVQYSGLQEQVNRSVLQLRQTGWLRETALKWGLYWTID
jgi:polar amino acid transport system substrate-binding protein